MSKKMAKTTNGATKKVKAEVVAFNPMLNCENGFTDDELVNSIKNKAMQAAVKSYRTNVVAGEKSAWGVAKACARMKIDVRKEFESDEALASFLGLSNKMAFSRLHRLGEYADKAMELGLTTTPVTELLVISGEKYGKQDVKDHLQAIVGMTKDEVRDYVKKFKVAIEDKSESENDSEPVESDSEPVESNIAGDTEEISWISVFSINADALNSMDDADRESLLFDLKGLVEKYGLSIDDCWIATK